MDLPGKCLQQAKERRLQFESIEQLKPARQLRGCAAVQYTCMVLAAHSTTLHPADWQARSQLLIAQHVPLWQMQVL